MAMVLPQPSMGRVLVVDDEPEILSLLTGLLSGQGYETVGTTRADEALAILRGSTFDILLTDLMMPQVDGISLLRSGLEADPNLVGIVVTGQGTVETAVDAMKVGAFDYLLKPFRLTEILPILARAMAVRRLRVENIQLRETVAIFEMSLAISRTLDFQRVLDEVVEAAIRQCEADEGSILLPSRDGDTLEVAAVRGAGRSVMIGRRHPLTEGIAGWVARSQEAVALVGPCADPRFTPANPRADIRYSVCTPMVVGGRLTGVLSVATTRERRPFTPGQIKALGILADIGAAALENARLHRQTSMRLSQLQALRTIDIAISSSLDLHVTLDVLLERVLTLGLDGATVLLFESGSQMYAPAASRGIAARQLDRTPIRPGEGPCGVAVLERRPVTSSDPAALPAHCPRCKALAQAGYRWSLALPLIAKGQVKGVLEVVRWTDTDLDVDQREFLEALAGQAAIAVDNAALFTDLARSNQELTLAYESTLEGWSRALDLRDRETEGHSQRVTASTLRLAEAVGIRPPELVHIRRGALLHDIGKLGIPDAILHKAGPLTDEEWKVMRRHPEYAPDMLQPIPFLRPAVDIPYSHHENWDGTGYPRGLKGEDIPTAARIFALADVWDALRVDRPYRQGLPDAEAREFIRSNRGVRFDPAIVDVFLSMDFPDPL